VTFVVVLAYISAALNVLSRIALVLVAGTAQAQSTVGAGRGVIVTGGVLSILVGIATLVVAGGLRHGRRIARMLVTTILAIQVVAAVVALTAGQAQAVQLIVQIAVAVAVTSWCGPGPRRNSFDTEAATRTGVERPEDTRPV
jgi:hypothetical protein